MRENVNRNNYLNLLMKMLTGELLDPDYGICRRDKFVNGDCVLGNLVPYNSTLRARGRDWPAFGLTMIGTARMIQFKDAIISVIKNNIKGDIAELGVWRGGACIWARKILDVYHENKRIVHVFDAFETIPGYNESYMNYLAVSQEKVMSNFKKFDADVNPVKFHKGLFKDTLPHFVKENPDVKSIAVLRIDGNFYDSYQDAMYYLYPLVPKGGIIIFDDVFTHKPVMKFWNDFKHDYSLNEELQKIDSDAAWFEKLQDVNLDLSKMRPPQDANKIKS